MSRSVSASLLGCAIAALVALAGCSHYFSGEREAWRRDAEVACISSGTVKEGPERVRISAIDGPGMCGAEYPLRVTALGESGALGYDDEPVRPPSSIPAGALPPRWPAIQSGPMPPPAQPSPAPQAAAAQSAGRPEQPTPAYRWQIGPQPALMASPAGAPMSLYPPGVATPEEDETDFQPELPQTYGAASAPRARVPSPRATTYSPRYPQPNTVPPNTQPRSTEAALPPAEEPVPPLGPPSAPTVTVGIGPVEIKPPATLACPIVSALDQWVTVAVQPAALRWFRRPVVEIKQISAYSCRGMNGNPNAHISEHAFGNALDIAEFVLADGHRISVQYGWRGSPEEQGFLHDVQLAACEQFTTVLAPGANVYHYNHIHVDLMRRSSGRHICEPTAIPGEVVAERARARYAASHPGEPAVTGSIKSKAYSRVLGYSDDDDRLPLAVPGED